MIVSEFRIAEVVVTHTYFYQPQDYLSFCELNEETPTEQGFLDFIRPEVNQDFPVSDWHPTRIVRLGDPEAERDDSDALNAIANLMHGTEWTPDTLDAIAEIVRTTGRPVGDPSDPSSNEED